MTRPAALFVFAALGVPAVAADPLPVAPPPREVRPDGSRDPAPAEDPAAVVERIIAGAKQASDKLAAADAGDGTRATQAGILKDIDALLNPPDSPPKDGGGSSDMNKQDKNDGKSDKGNDKSDAKSDMGKGGGQKEQKGDGKGNAGGKQPTGGTEPTGGMGQKEGQASGRRPRAGAPKDGKEPGGMAQGGKGADKQPMTPTQTAKAGTPKDPAGVAQAAADKKNDQPPPPVQPQLPIADVVAKEVWGHLPERVRVQLTQHYREEFMPRYAGLLRQYYSSLSSSPAGPPAPPR
ncbi:hypothetical protein [Urbifossiella limnaea]|uniref:Uncharacterized protein n=1 Tax=Urbifossiella limnaea TaxID=2528023 RepID=A0A517Y042_9BACT|nr:hypothetical protein [Urbifossiella limnaea]QDU23068.1 hypothetical protein ETAA1_50580 [Urbifossiella limnaea]